MIRRRVASFLAGAVLAIGAGAAAASGQAAQTPAPSAFDGTWDVQLRCIVSADGAAAYSFEFPAHVTDGVLHGENGLAGAKGWLSLDGPIEPDGSATLTAKGLTGSPRYSVGRVESLTSYSYHVAAHFDGKHGSGKRLEVRRCDLTFAKS